MSHNSPRAVGAVLASTVLLGSGPVAVRLANLGADDIVVLRLLLALPITCIALVLAPCRVDLRTLLRCAPGALLFALHLVLFFAAVRATGVADVTFVQAMQPVLVLAVAGRLFGESMTRTSVVLAFGGTTGVALVVFGSVTTGVANLTGELLAVANLVAWTAYFLVSKRTRTGVSALRYQTSVNLIGGVLAIPFFVLLRVDVTAASAKDWLVVAHVTLGAGIVGQLLLNWAHPFLRVTTSSVLVLCAPVVAAIGAALLLDQPITGWSVAGGALVLLCAAKASLIALERNRADSAPVRSTTLKETT
ncbi:DMT family transporter [Lentzea sp. NPDC051208]|uniref:DMT family transporter n=1 Tax=Lentzea sp. NPDC051208 TaxID=3154642 RepID=UPI0034416FF9